MYDHCSQILFRHFSMSGGDIEKASVMTLNQFRSFCKEARLVSASFPLRDLDILFSKVKKAGKGFDLPAFEAALMVIEPLWYHTRGGVDCEDGDDLKHAAHAAMCNVLIETAMPLLTSAGMDMRQLMDPFVIHAVRHNHKFSKMKRIVESYSKDIKAPHRLDFSELKRLAQDTKICPSWLTLNRLAQLYNQCLESFEDADESLMTPDKGSDGKISPALVQSAAMDLNAFAICLGQIALHSLTDHPAFRTEDFSQELCEAVRVQLDILVDLVLGCSPNRNVS
jgi:hypothetical protein